MALVLAGALACSPVPGGKTASVITVIAGPSGVNLNPYTNVLSSRQVGALLFRGMFAVDASGTPTPDLALEVPTKDNGGMNAEGTVIVYHLDPDAAWADGKPLTARDVVFTWELLASGQLIDDPRGTANVVSVVAVDPATVQLTLKRPDAPFAWRFVPYVLPEHLLGDTQDLLSDDFWVRPVGSRGRVADRVRKSTQVDLVDADGSDPTLRVVFTETDAGARTVWQSVEQCVWLNPPVGPTGAEQLSSTPSARWQAFVINGSDGHPTSDLAVREAFSAVTTVTVTPGTAGPYGLPIADSARFDEEVAAALERAGWREQPDGTRVKRGETLAVKVLFNPISAEEGDRIEYVIGTAIKRFGGSIVPNATFGYTDYVGGSRLALGDFDVALLEFPIGVPYGWAWPFESMDVPSEVNPAGLNVARASDPDLDAAAEAMRGAGSPAELRESLGAAWARLEELHLVLWDAQLEQQVLYKGLEGVQAEPFEEFALRSAGSWRFVGSGTGE